MGFCSLLFLIFVPVLIAGVLACPKFPDNPVIIRRFSKTFASIHFIYSLLFLIGFDELSYTKSYFTELTLFKQSWLQTLGIKASFAVDGLSLLFVILVSFITMISVFASRNQVKYSHKFYYSLLFIAQSSIIGLLCAQDMFVFFFFMELSLLPLYFLISHWSMNEDEKMARKFLGFNILGSFLILTPMLILYFYNFAITGTLSAGIETLTMDTFSYPQWFQTSIFVSFFLGFLIRAGIFPFHNWFIDCVEQAKIPVSIFLTSSFATTALYGILRFNIGEFPQICIDNNMIALILLLCGIIYIAFLLTVENNLKRICAYWAVIQNSLALIGLSVLNSLTYNGAILLILSSSIILSGYFIMAQILKRREHTYQLPFSNCLANSMPKFKIFSYFIFLASLITPFLFGFYSVLLIVLGVGVSDLQTSMAVRIITVLCAIMLFVTYIYLISVFHKMLFSHSEHKNEKTRDLALSENIVLSFIVMAIIFFGIYPMSLLNLINSTSHFVINVFRI